MRRADADLANVAAAAEATSTGDQFRSLSALANYTAAIQVLLRCR
jgi:hypothetical protein